VGEKGGKYIKKEGFQPADKKNPQSNTLSMITSPPTEPEKGEKGQEGYKHLQGGKKMLGGGAWCTTLRTKTQNK